MAESKAKNRTMTIRTIATLAGCAPSTVSRVLSGRYGNVRVSPPVQEHILEICRQHNYHPNIHASRAFSKRCGVLGLAVQKLSHFDDGNLSRYVDGLHETLSPLGYQLLLLSASEEWIAAGEHLAAFRRREMDGIFVWGHYGDPRWLDSLAEHGFPFIAAANRVGNHPSAICDEAAGMQALVNHCRSQGAQRLLYLSGCETIDCPHRRRHAFELAATDLDARVVTLEGFTISDGHRAAPTVADWRPDAVLCVNDATAVGVIMGLKETGVAVPEDIRVAGCDNSALAPYMFPALTTYDSMARECGAESVRAMDSHLGQGEPLTSIKLTPTLHIRESA
ncbi:MAG: LacI family DNA-binding transcriptional regulator [Lentisphaerae bacterium]|nr:LacI family DNA-binding transcriptional regulator [Lentisphaerota bacterium]